MAVTKCVSSKRLRFTLQNEKNHITVRDFSLCVPSYPPPSPQLLCHFRFYASHSVRKHSEYSFNYFYWAAITRNTNKKTITRWLVSIVSFFFHISFEMKMTNGTSVTFPRRLGE